MFRTQNLFACAAVGLLALGLLVSRFGPQTDLSVTSRTHTYAFSNQMPLYCIAALFAVFAFLYSIGYIPFASSMAKWHFWLSLASVLLCIAGWAIFYWYLSSEKDGTIGPRGMLVAGSFVAGLLTFVAMQMWFAVDLVRALLKMRNA